MSSELLESLVKHILNERQAKIYLTLISNKTSTVPEIFKLSQVPQKKIYEILKSLTNKGFVSKKQVGKIVFFEAINPKITFLQIIDEKEQQLKEINKLKDNLLGVFENTCNEKALPEYIEVVHGNINTHNKFVDMVKESKKSILSTSCPPFAITKKKQVIEQEEAYHKFHGKGGQDKTIHEVNDESPTFVFNNIREYLIHPDTFKVKVILKIPIKLFIFDDETLMTFDQSFMAKTGELSSSIIKQPNTVKTYIEMYNYLWDKAITVDEWLKDNRSLYERKLVEYDNSK